MIGKRPVRKSFSRKMREAVYAKCGGRCAYCGCDLNIHDMQIDHMLSLAMGGSDKFPNLMPSCQQCNYYKDTMTLESFREYIRTMLDRIFKKSFAARLAFKYGMFSIKEWDGKFYFERFKES